MPNTTVRRSPFRKRGQMPFHLSSLSAGTVTGDGGVVIGGSADVSFGHGYQVPSDIVVEWDLDNDGDFDEPEEDITEYVLSLQTMTGRDWPSLLTGKAGPGHLRATLRNDDNRFSYFNTSSPLVTPPFTLKTGRKIRIRMAGTSSPDPILLAKDRFGRANGALGTPETGANWSDPLANDFAIVSMRARPATEGATHIAVIDVADTDYYAQVRMSEIGSGTNVVGLVYRYQDTDDYSLAVVDVSAQQLKLINVVAGVATTIESENVETYDDMTIGVYVTSNSVTMYHEGVPVMVDTAIQTDETEVGIYAAWGTNDVRPAMDNFYVWDGLLAETEGIIWTGDVSDLGSTVFAGPEKMATLEGRGWLSRLATQKLMPIRTASGMKTGILVGNILARTNLLHPPGFVDEGDITTGAIGLPEQDGIEAARNFEEVEFGFLYESNEGPLNYESRTARAGAVSAVTFTDAAGGTYGYTGIEPLDWRREVFNRVIAGVSPMVPSGVTRTTYTQNAITAESVPDGVAYVPFAVLMPATVNAGDLLLIAMSITATGTVGYDDNFVTPPGWIDLSRKSSGSALSEESFDGTRVFAKVADGTEDGTSPVFFTTSSPGVGANTRRGGIAHIFRVTDWFGSIESGISISDWSLTSDPAAVFPSWGPAPSLLIAVRNGFRALGTIDVSPATYPLGYSDGTTTTDTVQTQRMAMQSAWRFGAMEVENPGAFSGDFEPWVSAGMLDTVTIAVRGFNGSPPQSNPVTVQLDDLDSQDDHNFIRTHDDAPQIFASEADAETYAELVLDTYADDRPIVSLKFVATKSGAYRNQAVRRRVGDKITLVATNNAGLGISSDFFIENIEHTWREGKTLWETVWQLSPAA